ncbi:MAG TPA: hypothetical protein VMR52_06520 [Dehalococcoidia bacterium]|nr:hypothetical protein [Dehalococcoidia bacterium]
MSDQPAPEPRAEEGRRNALLALSQTPRILLLLLAAWSILGVLAETFTSSGIFLENHHKIDGENLELELDGALGGFALGWEGIPLAALYIYCFRNPDRYNAVFVLALIHMAALFFSQLYHWLGTSDFSFESVAVPMIGSAVLGAACFLHMFQEREAPKTSES